MDQSTGRTLIGCFIFTVVSSGGGGDSVIFHTTIQTLNTPTSVGLTGRGPWRECILCCRHGQDQTVQTSSNCCRRIHSRAPRLPRYRYRSAQTSDGTSLASPTVSSCRGVTETATSREQCRRRGQQEAENRFLQRQTDCSCVMSFSHSLTLIVRETCAL